MVRRYLSALLGAMLLLLVSCSPSGVEQQATSFVGAAATATPAATLPSTATVEASATPLVPTTVAPTPSAVPTSAATETAPPPPITGDLSLDPDHVFVYPVPVVYSGERVTFNVLAHVPPVVNPGDVAVRLQVADLLDLEGTLNKRNLAGDASALFTWVWDTTGLTGEYPVTVTLDPGDSIQVGDENPGNNQASLNVAVQPARNRPSVEAENVWVTVETGCCRLHVVDNTAAARDLPELQAAVDRAVQQAIDRLGQWPQDKIDLYFVDRVLGQGGYALHTLVISYLDRNYAGGGLHEVLTHEIAHLLDWQAAAYRVPFLDEGLAVWTAGGHYKQEDLQQRVLALRELGGYVPLRQLIDDFYPHQHEVGYLQAGAFVDYLVQHYGSGLVRAFYEDVQPQQGRSLSEVVDVALQSNFGKTLDEMEAEWMASLDIFRPDPLAVADLQTTIRYYDLVRAYQLAYDPTAHFLQAWLPDPVELQDQQLTAEVTRHPDDEVNITLEVMLHAVDHALQAGDYDQANVVLDSVERALHNGGMFLDPLGIGYREIVRKLTSVGYEVHQVEMDGNRALARVSAGRFVTLNSVSLMLRNQNWVLVN